MKKILLLLLTICFFSSTLFAGTKLIQRSEIKDKFAVYEMCTGGYKFVVVRSLDYRGVPATGGIAAGLSLVQVFDSSGKGVRC